MLELLPATLEQTEIFHVLILPADFPDAQRAMSARQVA